MKENQLKEAPAVQEPEQFCNHNELKGYLCGVINGMYDTSSLERIFYFTKGLQTKQPQIRIPEQEEAEKDCRELIIKFLYNIPIQYLDKVYYYVKAKYNRSIHKN